MVSYFAMVLDPQDNVSNRLDEEIERSVINTATMDDECIKDIFKSR